MGPAFTHGVVCWVLGSELGPDLLTGSRDTGIAGVESFAVLKLAHLMDVDTEAERDEVCGPLHVAGQARNRGQALGLLCAVRVLSLVPSPPRSLVRYRRHQTPLVLASQVPEIPPLLT